MGLRALSFVVLGIAAGWCLMEILAGGSPIALAALLLVWAALIIGTVAAPRTNRAEWERGSRVALGVVFLMNRIAVLGLDVVTVAAFLAVLSILAVVQRYDRLFGRAYRSMGTDTRHLRDMDSALVRSLGRAIGLIALALLFTLVAANAIALGFLPLTSSVTALVLALLFIGVVSRLARPRPTEEPPGAGNV